METTLLSEKDTVLAILGGNPVRKQPLPARKALGSHEKAMIDEVVAWYQAREEDPSYQGHFETQYCDAFAQWLGGGYADAVATGTVALFVALSALNLPKGSEVLVSPITDPGTLSAIILAGLKPALIDTEAHSFNVGLSQITERLRAETRCVLIVHAAGRAVAETPAIVDYCHQHQVSVLEDCSQAHGAWGDIAAFSTMYRKASITGSCGGVVYTRDQTLYFNALAHADRGKPRWQADFDDRNPQQFLFPALNLHSNEIACGIGLASLRRLPQTIERRLVYLKALTKALQQQSQVCTPYGVTDEDSPFYYPVFVNELRLRVTKIEFARAVQAEGIGLNPHYRYLVEDWDWVRPYLADTFRCMNARHARDTAFCLYVNENYDQQALEDTVAAILKVERHYRC